MSVIMSGLAAVSGHLARVPHLQVLHLHLPGVVISLIFPKFSALDPIILSNFNDPL